MTDQKQRNLIYRSGKTYTHNTGLSCAFRQWRAESHCRFIHGYALQVEVTFESTELDDHNWVVDFGDLKLLKGEIEHNYDHKLLVARDDPHIKMFKALDSAGAADVRYMDEVGCEAFAEEIFRLAEECLLVKHYKHEVKVISVVVREHASNWAGVFLDPSGWAHQHYRSS